MHLRSLVIFIFIFGLWQRHDAKNSTDSEKNDMNPSRMIGHMKIRNSRRTWSILVSN